MFLCLYITFRKKNKKNGKTPSSVNVVRAAQEYWASPRKGSLRLIQNQFKGCFYIKVIIAVPFRNNKLPLQNYWKSDYFVTFLTIVQKKKREKDLKAKRQMRKAKNTDKIASHHLAIFCIFKQITYYFQAWTQLS